MANELVGQLDIEVEALKHRIRRLEAALKPFAEVARVFDEDMRGSCMPRTGEFYSWPRMRDGEMYVYTLTVEHLREARNAVFDLPMGF